MPNRVPPNVCFVIDDMELRWTYQDNFFDYIHMRSLSGTVSDWDGPDGVLAQAFRWVPKIGHACYIAVFDLVGV